jgi:hypothetical protein
MVMSAPGASIALLCCCCCCQRERGVTIVLIVKFQPCDHTPPGTQRLMISHKLLGESFTVPPGRRPYPPAWRTRPKKHDLPRWWCFVFNVS